MVSTHTRLMCKETKPHVKLWLQLTQPHVTLDKITRQTSAPSTATTTTSSTSGARSTLSSEEPAPATTTTTSGGGKDVPLLLRDPIASLLLLVANTYATESTATESGGADANANATFNAVVAAVFKMTFVQAVVQLCRRFDADERASWSQEHSTASGKHSKGCMSWHSFGCYVANAVHVMSGEKKEHEDAAADAAEEELEEDKPNKTGRQSYVMKTIWTPESAKNYVYERMMHFVRVAALLKSYVCDGSDDAAMPLVNGEASSSSLSFDSLLKWLSIDVSRVLFAESSATSGGQHDLVATWLSELNAELVGRDREPVNVSLTKKIWN